MSIHTAKAKSGECLPAPPIFPTRIIRRYGDYMPPLLPLVPLPLLPDVPLMPDEPAPMPDPFAPAAPLPALLPLDPVLPPVVDDPELLIEPVVSLFRQSPFFAEPEEQLPSRELP